MKSMTRLSASCLVLVLMAAGLRAQGSQDTTTQLLSQPPSRASQLAIKRSDILKVDFLKADFDGSGKFQFIVAFYSLQGDGQGVFLRVFKQQPTGLLLVGDQEDQNTHGGFGLTIHLVDIKGDGIPEIDIEGHQSDGSQVFHEYFTWTGHSLHSSIDAVADAELEDIDGDGVLELVTSNGDGSFNIYKYSGTDFTLSQTLNHDPRGFVGADGKINLVRAHLSSLKPHDFPLEEVKEAISRHRDHDKRQSDGDTRKVDKVRFIIGDLRDLHGKAVIASDIDTTTLVLVRNLRPLGVQIRPSQDGDDGDDTGGHKPNPHSVLELEFARRDVLRLLPGLKLTAPLASGDKLQLRVYGKLSSGMRVSAGAFAVIRGEDRDRNHHHDGGN